MELLKRIEELKREILNNPSDSFDIILNNIPKLYYVWIYKGV